MNIIATNIVRRRKELKMTQRDLAEKLHISDKTVSRWETGNQIPDALTIPEIAKVLDMTIDELYGAEGDKAEQEETTESKEDEDKNEKKETKEYPNLKYGAILIFKVALLIGVFVCFGLSTMAASNTMFFLNTWRMIYGLAFAGIGLFFLICEITFHEFYKKKEYAFYYEIENVKWFGLALVGVNLIIAVWMPLMQNVNTYAQLPYLGISVMVVFNIFLIVISIWYRQRLKKKDYEIQKGLFWIPLLLTGLGIIIIIWYIRIANQSLTAPMGGMISATYTSNKMRLFVVLAGVVMVIAQGINYILTIRIWKQKEMSRKLIQRCITVIAVIMAVCMISTVFPYTQYTVYDLLSSRMEEEDLGQCTIESISFGVDFGTGKEGYNYFTLNNPDNIAGVFEQFKKIQIEKGEVAEPAQRSKACFIQFEGNIYKDVDFMGMKTKELADTISWDVTLHEYGEIWYGGESYRITNSVDWNELLRLGISEYEGSNRYLYNEWLK